MNELSLKANETPNYPVFSPDYIKKEMNSLLSLTENKFSEIEGTLSEKLGKNADIHWEDFFPKMSLLDEMWQRVWAPVSHIYSVINSPELRTVYEEFEPKVVALGLKMEQSEIIYQALKNISSQSSWQQLSRAQQRTIQIKMQRQELSGIALPAKERQEFSKIEEELSKLSTLFSNNVLDSNKAFELIVTSKSDLDGLPGFALNFAANSYNQAKSPTKPSNAEEGPWRFTLDAPSYVPFLMHASNRDLREKMYRAYITQASSGSTNNQEVIKKILDLRYQKAKQLGFKSFAEVSLAAKMAKKPDTVVDFCEKLLTASKTKAQADFESLKKFARESKSNYELTDWDISYWTEKQKEHLYGYSEEQVRPYFVLDHVLKGLFSLSKDIFGIELKPAQKIAWHKDVQYFDVIDTHSQKKIAGFFLDPFARPGQKRPGAWMNEILGRRVFPNQEIQHPIAVLVCNFMPPSDLQPSLLSLNEVNTMFHEFGHGLQHMLTSIDVSEVAGINGVEWDAVELPSQFMENWVFHRPTLKNLSKHFQTGAQLPDELIDKIIESRKYFAAWQMLRQLQLAMTDQELHKKDPLAKDFDPFEIHRNISLKTSLLPPRQENRFLCAFSHIFAGGYAAGYYSYKWAEVLSADAFSAFKELLDKNASREELSKLGKKYRQTILGLGGSEEPGKVFKEFRGRDFKIEPLLEDYGII